MVYGLCASILLIFSVAADQQDQPWSYDPKGKRDPFIPLVRDGRIVSVTGDLSSPGASVPLLAGILWDPGGHSIALINDTEVMVGETVSGYQLAEIRPDAVVLVRDGEPLVLQITFEEPVKSLPALSAPGTSGQAGTRREGQAGKKGTK